MNETSAMQVQLTNIYQKVDELETLPLFKQAPEAIKVMKALLFLVAELVDRVEVKTDE